MFIQGKARAWSTRRGEQRARGYYLVLMDRASDQRPMIEREIRGLVRAVELRQSGHFMSGSIAIPIGQLGTAHIHVEGDYGANGLIRGVPDEVFELGAPLTPELRTAWNQGGGHNSAGNEAPLLDAWARTLRYPASTMRGNK